MKRNIRKDLIEGKYRPRAEGIKLSQEISYRPLNFKSAVLYRGFVKMLDKMERSRTLYDYGLGNLEYTYKEWLEGKRVPTARNYKGDSERIKKEQTAAYEKMLDDHFQLLKGIFLNDYEESLLPFKYLKAEIKEIESRIDHIESNYYVGDRLSLSDELTHKWLSHSLSKKDVDRINSFDYQRDNRNLTEEQQEEIEDILDDLNFRSETIKKSAYIVNCYFLRWLLWFEDKENAIKAEPTIQRNSRIGSNPNDLIRLKPRSISNTTYQWQGKLKEELPELYEKMKGKLIATESTFEHLEAIFTKQPLTSITALKWHDDNATELLYFIQQLVDKEVVEGKGQYASYTRLKACFVKPNGLPFTTSFKALDPEYDLSNAKKAAIDELVACFI